MHTPGGGYKNMQIFTTYLRRKLDNRLRFSENGTALSRVHQDPAKPQGPLHSLREASRHVVCKGSGGTRVGAGRQGGGVSWPRVTDTMIVTQTAATKALSSISVEIMAHKPFYQL